MTNPLNWLAKGPISLDKQRFIAVYCDQFYQPNYNSSKSGLDRLLRLVESDPAMAHRSWVAYVFATVLVECGKNFRPIEEAGKITYFDKYDTPPLSVVLGNKSKGDGYFYRGRGYCQITGRAHYENFGKRVGLDLIKNPELALQPEVSYRIMSDGLVHGLFTGVSLSQYLNETRKDYVNARRIINGLDRAQEVAMNAMKFEICLKESEVLR